jgi:diaminopimelate dehydrogenase
LKAFAMMNHLSVAVVGYGNVGRGAVEAVLAAPDMELAGVVDVIPIDLPGVPTVNDISLLKKVDVALLCIPSILVPEVAPAYLARGIHTVDSFDMHGEKLWQHHQNADQIGKKHNAVAVISAGWDPGSDSVIRVLLMAMAPKGLTYVNFGPGMSMGHSVCAKSKKGVKDALSITVPIGSGLHRRMVYVELEDGTDIRSVEQAIKTDDYFVRDETHVIVVSNLSELKDMGHSVHLERKGVSGITHGQRFEYRMTINNPALTSQIMVSCARAAARLKPGAYAMPEIAPLDLLPGDRETLLKTLI